MFLRPFLAREQTHLLIGVSSRAIYLAREGEPMKGFRLRHVDTRVLTNPVVWFREHSSLVRRNPMISMTYYDLAVENALFFLAGLVLAMAISR